MSLLLCTWTVLSQQLCYTGQQQSATQIALAAAGTSSMNSCCRGHMAPSSSLFQLIRRVGSFSGQSYHHTPSTTFTTHFKVTPALSTPDWCKTAEQISTTSHRSFLWLQVQSCTYITFQRSSEIKQMFHFCVSSDLRTQNSSSTGWLKKSLNNFKNWNS